MVEKKKEIGIKKVAERRQKMCWLNTHTHTHIQRERDGGRVGAKGM